MKNLLLISVLTIGLFSCKKAEETKPAHNIQFNSNIKNPEHYELTINGLNSDLSNNYSIEGSVDLKLKLYTAGGDSTSINGKDSLWIRATIYVDGYPVKAFAGYHDTTLIYQIN